MIGPGYRTRRWAAVAWLASAAWSGCASANPQSTHEGKLLDHKVTAERVQAALRKAGPEFREVGVEGAREGITLTGSVPSVETRARAEEIANQVDPNVKVTDQLAIR